MPRMNASPEAIERLMAASPHLPVDLADLVTVDPEPSPQPGELWRIGRDEAVLVWVRRVFDDGGVDVIPVVLDVEWVDSESVLIDPDRTPLRTDLAAVTTARTHVMRGVFLTRICVLDLAAEVAEVMAAAREGRSPQGVRVGEPIVRDDDERIRYRQVVAAGLTRLAGVSRG